MTHYIITETRINSMSNPEVSVVGLLDSESDAKQMFYDLVEDAAHEYEQKNKWHYDTASNINYDGKAEFYNEEDPLMDYCSLEIHKID